MDATLDATDDRPMDTRATGQLGLGDTAFITQPLELTGDNLRKEAAVIRPQQAPHPRRRSRSSDRV